MRLWLCYQYFLYLVRIPFVTDTNYQLFHNFDKPLDIDLYSALPGIYISLVLSLSKAKLKLALTIAYFIYLYISASFCKRLLSILMNRLCLKKLSILIFCAL